VELEGNRVPNALTGTPLARLRKKECWARFANSLQHAIQWRRQQIPAELPRLAKGAGDRRNPLLDNALLNTTLNYDRATGISQALFAAPV